MGGEGGKERRRDDEGRVKEEGEGKSEGGRGKK